MSATPLPEPSGGGSLQSFLRVQKATERELVSQLSDAARYMERRMRATGPPSGAVRQAQMRAVLQEINILNDNLWNGAIGDNVSLGKYRAARQAATTAGDQLWAYLKERGYTALSKAEWEQALRAQARSGIQNVVYRSANNVPLSERVYRNGSLSSGRIDQIVNNGLVAGNSAREIARDVARYVNPSTPGGASYAAMRLGRTEINNAYHTSTIAAYSDNPFVDAMEWRLSGSHPRTDACDGIAESGPYDPKDVPSKPHPNCFCTVFPTVSDEKKFIKDFKAGKFDDWIDEQSEAADSLITETNYAAALTQKRVFSADAGAVVPVTSLKERAGLRYYTGTERQILRETGYYPW